MRGVSERAEVVLPSHEDRVVRGLSEVVGGPPGDHARIGGPQFWTPVRVVLALALVMLSAGWLQKAPCRNQPWANGFQYSHACYSDVTALYFAEELDKGKVPYRDHDVEYPVLTGALMGLVGLEVHHMNPVNPGRWFFDLTALVLGLCGVIAAWATARTHRRRPYDAALLAFAPAMLVTAFVNWDLLAVALTAGAMLAWSRRHPWWAGVLFGLATAAKFYPLLLLGPLFLLCLRAGKLGHFFRTFVAAAVAWAAVNIPVELWAPHGWKTFFRLSETRGSDWGTIWYWMEHYPGQKPFDRVAAGQAPHTLNTLVAIALVAGCIAIAGLILFAPRRPRFPQVAFLVVAVFLLTGKVWSQQYVLWLIPLAALARPRWPAFLAWQATELAYFGSFYLMLLGVTKNKEDLGTNMLLLTSAARWGGVLLICGLVVSEILRPAKDVVRRDGADDPAGGVLDGAPDRLWRDYEPEDAAIAAA